MQAVLAMLAAFGISAVLVPHTMRLAPLIGAVDVPRDGRRLHKRPLPRTGGIAIFLAFVIGTALVAPPHEETVRLFLGATLLLLLGIWDDVYRLSAGVKLIVQILAALLVLGGAEEWTLFGYGGGAEALRLVVSVLWLVALINAHNMIDGLDGLCAGVGAVEAAVLALLLAGQGGGVWAGTSLVLGGAALGFWLYNRHPARIFMGDAGSQVVGMILGYLALRLDGAQMGTLGTLVPLLLFGVPLSDLVFAVLRRLLRGQSPFAADRGHWHHRLFDAGYSQTWTCRILLFVSILLGASALGVSREAWYGYAVYSLLWIVFLVSLVGMRSKMQVFEK
jgi:UDP-GlcNAc:undecaprenyl-phosphate GlcNAc-1-phosphate transferase